jgi:hypothetical protein
MPLLETFANASLRGFRAGGGAGGNAMELISTQILGIAAATITFSSIPQTYKHLQLRVVVRGSQAFNGVSSYTIATNGASSVYSYHSLVGNGSSVTSFDGNTRAPNWGIGVMSIGNDPANAFGASIYDFLDYTASSKNTTVRGLSGGFGAGVNNIRLDSGAYNATGATTSITLSNGGGNFVVGSRFSLYGVKG